MGTVTVTLDSTTTVYGSGGPTHTAGADQRLVTGSLAMSTTYAQGGDAITAGALALGVIDDIKIEPTQQFGVTLIYTGRTTSTIKMFNAPAIMTTGASIPATAEMTTGTDAHTVIARFFAWGV